MEVSESENLISQTENKSLQSDNNIIKETLDFLTSDECSGRMTGTEGNELAQDYIVNRLKEYGVEPYEGDFYHKFNQTMNYEKQEKVKLKLYTKEGNIKELKYGSDFINGSLFKEQLELPVYFEPNMDKHILVIEELEEVQKTIDDENIKGLLVLTDEINRNIIKNQNNKRKPMFFITKGTYDSIEKNVGQTVIMSMDYETRDMEESNVVGVIKGENSNKAILISAHLDHLGSIGDSIWRGAIDNASGIAVLLDIAQTLKENVDTDELNVDIIFCAFNSEEAGLIGSKSISNELQKKYSELININIDCIGEKNKSIYIDSRVSDISKELSNSLKQFLVKNNYDVTVTQGKFPSDHINFTNGINISTDITNSPLHTLNDTVDKLDLEYMESISENIAKFIINYIKETNNVQNNNNGNHVKIQQQLEKEKSKLKFGEYKKVKIENKEYIIENSSFLGNLQEVRDIYEDFNYIPLKISNIKLDHIQMLTFRGFSDLEPQQLEENKVYRINHRPSNINSFYFKYKDESEHSQINISFQTYNKNDKYEVQFKDNIMKLNNYKISNDNLVKGKKYDFYFNKHDEESLPLILLIEEGDNYIHMSSITTFGLGLDTKEKFIKFIDDNNIEDIIEKTFNWLKSDI